MDQDGRVMEVVTSVSEATGLLIIRAVVEPGSSTPLRAYIRETGDVSIGFERTTTVADVEAALAVVRTWLDRTLDAGRLGESVAPERPR
jgi:hypothetical protein